MLNALPDLMYNFSSNQLDAKFILAKNIWKRGELLSEFKQSLTLFNEYIVQNGERPEDISTQIYNNPFYNWTILIINDITDYYAQWPRSVRQLQEYVDNKYTNSAGTKHYITTEVTDDNGNIICPAGKIVPQTFQVAYYNGSTTVTANPTVSVSNYQYEEELNAKKEKIQIVRPEVIEDFVSVYYQLLVKDSTTGTQVGSTLSDISM
ncbi:MAG: hypothetical protein CMA53_02345 [Euryarchaeota archaeon]|nr:hypothetical protein [Euryarchaeota archaeon]|tara:strand:+ start:4240 stop:4860 length:621 start_codon:yes stop_codon:yes gene_type:complete